MKQSESFVRPFIAHLLFLTICFSLSQTGLLAQTFLPFSSDTRTLFTTAPVPGATSSLAFTSVETVGSDSNFVTVKIFDSDQYDELIDPDSDCLGFWATAGLCYPQNIPLWFGQDITKASLGTYLFSTANYDTLRFDFNIAEGDSSFICQAGTQLFYLIGEGKESADILGYTDSIARYRIAHLNLLGNPVNSDLHDAPISVGKTLGLIDFMRIDSFPQILQPIQMVGHAEAELGLYQIKFADISDYSVGDITQRRHHSSLEFPFNTIIHYVTTTILSRTETEEDISYTFLHHKFNSSGSMDTTYNSVSTVSKTEILDEIPFEVQENWLSDEISYPPYQYKFLDLTPDECGGYSFKQVGTDLYACLADSIPCYGDPRNMAPGDWYSLPGVTSLQQGLGVTFRSSGWNIISGPSGASGFQLIYSVKNGVVCGEQVILSASNNGSLDDKLKLFPNPARNQINVEIIGSPIEYVEVFDLLGKSVSKDYYNSNSINLDISDLPQGSYLLSAQVLHGIKITKRFVVQR